MTQLKAVPLQSGTAGSRHVSRQCRNCDFYSQLNTECRAQPPVAMMAMSAKGPITLGAFPPIDPDRWCGRFTPATGEA